MRAKLQGWERQHAISTHQNLLCRKVQFRVYPRGSRYIGQLNLGCERLTDLPDFCTCWIKWRRFALGSWLLRRVKERIEFGVDMLFAQFHISGPPIEGAIVGSDSWRAIEGVSALNEFTRSFQRFIGIEQRSRSAILGHRFTPMPFRLAARLANVLAVIST